MSDLNSSDLSDPPSPAESDGDELSTAVPSSRPSVDITHADIEAQGPPTKRRKTTNLQTSFERPPSSHAGDDNDDNMSISSDGWSSAPGSPTHDEYAVRDDAQTQCLWKDCNFGNAQNNDELVAHVQATHCATGGPKKTKYVCEWGECQKKASTHPSGYALKAHMRSHTKEKPYYCQLPECDKAFTRSDALAKHMRTVHEPENAKNDVVPTGRGRGKGRNAANGSGDKQPESMMGVVPPALDENGNEIDPSPPGDNIRYVPAHHPITGQPGFMIHYPPDTNFSTWESSMNADMLMRLIRRQVHWAQQDQEALKKEIEELEEIKKQEWLMKEAVLEGLMEAELARGAREGILRDVNDRVLAAMEEDTGPSKGPVEWEWEEGFEPAWRRNVPLSRRRFLAGHSNTGDMDIDSDPVSPSPPATGRSGGFDGDADPYDNYLSARMAEYEERERLRDIADSPSKGAEERQSAAEADAVGALVGLSGAAS